MKIHDWEDIADKFTDGLLLGNGGSIAVDTKFNYPSLYEHALKLKQITEPVAKLFGYFGTDFEYVLRMLMYATAVNEALEIDDEFTEIAYVDTRRALIETVRDIHPKYEKVAENLPKIANFMGRFNTVVSLSYDLLVYWAMLCEHQTGITFKDCFNKGGFDDNWERFRELLPGQNKACLVFYPHGNLILSTGLSREENKISNEKEGRNLLENIIRKWEEEKDVPLFVSEGTKERKRQSIQVSYYLRIVYDEVLTDINESLVIFGCALADTDDHILEKIVGNGLKRLAVSVWIKDADYQEKCAIIELKIKRIIGDIEIYFFDSESKNCWIHSDYNPDHLTAKSV